MPLLHDSVELIVVGDTGSIFDKPIACCKRFCKISPEICSTKVIASFCNAIERHLTSSEDWNPRLTLVAKINSVDLPLCHISYGFVVSRTGKGWRSL